MSKTSIALALASILFALFGLAVGILPGRVLGQTDPTKTKPQHSAFACNRLALTPDQRKHHFDELGPKLLSLKQGVRELPNGYEFEFPADPSIVRLVAEWAAYERDCCPFFDIDLHLEREGGPLWLSLTGREGVKEFIRADAPAWIAK
ncbi:MAG TPA: hypothetical protein VEI99_05605 [Terriglobales bacterium]|nr:hypothetical protein [Terriglobales bacterium]